MLHLTCVSHHPLTPNLTPGTRVSLALDGAQLTLRLQASPLMLHNLICAMEDGALTAPDLSPDEAMALLQRVLSAQAAAPLRRAG